MAVLVRGQKVDLTKANPALGKIKVGLGWDISNSDQTFHLNATALMVNVAGQIASKENIVFYNNLISLNGEVQLSRDSRKGEDAGDDVQIIINL